MIDLKSLQQRIWDNKVKKGFNTTEVNQEFLYAYEELSEAYGAYRKKLPDLGEEIADVAIYLLGISEMMGVDLEQEILKKVEKNEQREYKMINGVLTKAKSE